MRCRVSVSMNQLGRAIPLAAVALAPSCGGESDRRARVGESTRTAPAVAVAMQRPLAGGRVEVEEETDPSEEGRQETMARARAEGFAEWALELDPFDLRRKVTIRIALRTPDSTLIVLRAIDSTPPAPGVYGVMLPSTGASHHDPQTFKADIHTTEVGQRRNYVLGGFDQDTVIIEAPPAGIADATLRGRIRLRGSRYADAKPGMGGLRDWVSRNVFGSFIAPRAAAPRPSVLVTPAMQEAVLRNALDGYVITNSGAINGDGPVDSTTTSERARRFLETRWSAAAVVDSVVVNGRAYHIRLRGRLVSMTCEVDSTDERITCRR